MNENQQKSEVNSVDEAKKVLAEMRAENDRREEMLQRDERLHASQILSGHAEAGREPEAKKEETPKEYKDRVMRGGI